MRSDFDLRLRTLSSLNAADRGRLVNFKYQFPQMTSCQTGFPLIEVS